MSAAGFRLSKPDLKHGGGYGQSAWIHPSRDDVCVELHWNLINSPQQRGRSSVEYHHLVGDNESQQADNPLSPAALLLIAAIHATHSHQFDRLQLVYDLVQAARGSAGRIDVDRLVDMAAETNTSYALYAALKVAAQAVRDQSVARLARRLAPRLASSLPGHWLISNRVLRQPDSRLASRHRRGFREVLKRAA